MNEKIFGKVTVSDRAIMQIASYAARHSKGVAAMTDKSRQDELRRVVKNGIDTAGIYLLKTKNGVEFEVYAACEYGARIQEVRNNISANVKSAFSDTGITVNNVNVHINSVK